MRKFNATLGESLELDFVEIQPDHAVFMARGFLPIRVMEIETFKVAKEAIELAQKIRISKDKLKDQLINTMKKQLSKLTEKLDELMTGTFMVDFEFSKKNITDENGKIKVINEPFLKLTVPNPDLIEKYVLNMLYTKAKKSYVYPEYNRVLNKPIWNENVAYHLVGIMHGRDVTLAQRFSRVYREIYFDSTATIRAEVVFDKREEPVKDQPKPTPKPNNGHTADPPENGHEDPVEEEELDPENGSTETEEPTQEDQDTTPLPDDPETEAFRAKAREYEGMSQNKLKEKNPGDLVEIAESIGATTNGRTDKKKLAKIITNRVKELLEI